MLVFQLCCVPDVFQDEGPLQVPAVSASRVAHGPGQKEDGLLSQVGAGSGFGLAAPLQPHVPAVLLGAVSVEVILLVLLQEATLVIEALLRGGGNERGE